MNIFNYGCAKKPQANTIGIQLKWLTLYFSYDLVMGILVSWGSCRRLILRKSPTRTTSKHLKWILQHCRSGDREENVESGRFDEILRKIESALPTWDAQLCDEILSIMGDKEAQRRDGVW